MHEWSHLGGGIWLWGIQINSKKYWTGSQLCTKPYGIQHIRQWVASLVLRTRRLGNLWNFCIALATNSLPKEVHLTLLLLFLICHLPPKEPLFSLITVRLSWWGGWRHSYSAFCSMFFFFLPFCFDRMEQFTQEPGRMKVCLGRKAISHINEQGYMVRQSLRVKYVTVQNGHSHHFRILHF